MTQTGAAAFCEKLIPSIFDTSYDHPREDGPCAYFDIINNIWTDDNGIMLTDLKEMGFTARMRETILIYIHRHQDIGYVSLINNWGDSVELFW